MTAEEEFKVEYGRVLLESLSSEEKEKMFKIMEGHFTEGKLVEMKGIARTVVNLKREMDHRLAEHDKKASSKV